jgi:hypothetical protein
MFKILFVFAVLLVNSCQAQDTSKRVVNNPGNTPSVMPFEIENQKDCLDIDGCRGSLLLSLFVSEEGIIKDFNVSHLKIAEGSDTVLTYTKMVYEPMKLKDYPEQVKFYYPHIKDFVGKLVLKPKDGVKAQNTNIIYFNIKIGCE